MKKFSIVIVLILAILTCALSPTMILKADSGWDADYDSRSSSDSKSSDSSGSSHDYSSSWDYEYDYGSHSSYSSHSSGEFPYSFFEIISILVVIIAPAVYVLPGCFNGDFDIAAWLEKIKDNKIKKKSVSIKEYGLDENEILTKAYNIYKDVQIAWMNFDYNTLRKNLSDELFNTYKMQLEALKLKKQKNIMRSFSKKDMKIVSINETNGLITLEIELKVSQRDFVVNEKNKCIKGRRFKKIFMYYLLTFTMTKEKNSLKCPNCGSPISNSASNICSYCGSVIVTRNHELVMTKKRAKHQRFGYSFMQRNILSCIIVFIVATIIPLVFKSLMMCLLFIGFEFMVFVIAIIRQNIINLRNKRRK